MHRVWRVGQMWGQAQALRPPLLSVWVDGEVAPVAVWAGREALEHHARFPGMPLLTPEGQLRDVLTRLARHYPAPAQSVELYAQWPGNPRAWSGPPKVLIPPRPTSPWRRDDLEHHDGVAHSRSASSSLSPYSRATSRSMSREVASTPR